MSTRSCFYSFDLGKSNVDGYFKLLFASKMSKFVPKREKHTWKKNEYVLVLFVFRDGTEEVLEICLLALSIRKGSFSAVGNDYRSNMFRNVQDRFHGI